jgi:hypothetical protein
VRVALQPLAEREPVHARQVDVEHDRVRPVRADREDRRSRVLRLVQLDVERLQGRLQEGSDPGLVVDQQYAQAALLLGCRTHGLPTSRGARPPRG